MGHSAVGAMGAYTKSPPLFIFITCARRREAAGRDDLDRCDARVHALNINVGGVDCRPLGRPPETGYGRTPFASGAERAQRAPFGVA